MSNPTLKNRETLLFFLIAVINGLICIASNIREIIKSTRKTADVVFPDFTTNKMLLFMQI